MMTHVEAWIPIEPTDVPRLERVLSDADPLLIAGVPAPFDYSFARFLAGTDDGTTFRALMDRNLTTRAISLAKGGAIGQDHPSAATFRITAACMAFLQTTDSSIEPNVSLYENPERAIDDLHWWRVADHIHPQAYVNVALGRTDTIPEHVLTDAWLKAAKFPAPPTDFAARLYHWERHYCTLLKIAELDRGATLRGAAKLHTLWDWSMQEGFMNAAASMFALRLFGSTRSQRMLRGVRSCSYDRCIRGVRNAAWDLTYVSQWARHTRTDRKHLWMFWTNDHLLRDLARALLLPKAKDERHALYQALRENFPQQDAAGLLAHHDACLEQIQKGARDRILQERFTNIDAITTALTVRLRSTFPATSAVDDQTSAQHAREE